MKPKFIQCGCVSRNCGAVLFSRSSVPADRTITKPFGSVSEPGNGCAPAPVRHAALPALLMSENVGRLPEETTSATALPIGLVVPPAGFWLITAPAGTVLLSCLVTVLVRPR